MLKCLISYSMFLPSRYRWPFEQCYYTPCKALRQNAHLSKAQNTLKDGFGRVLAGDLASLAIDGSIFAATAAEKLTRLQEELEPLAARYDVAVANPPVYGCEEYEQMARRLGQSELSRRQG